MRRRLLCSLLLIVTAASLSSGAIWQPVTQQPAPQPTISAEEAALIAMVMFDGGEDPCPSLVDPNAPPNRWACQAAARLDYLLIHHDCAKYILEHNACSGIPN